MNRFQRKQYNREALYRAVNNADPFFVCAMPRGQWWVVDTVTRANISLHHGERAARKQLRRFNQKAGVTPIAELVGILT